MRPLGSQLAVLWPPFSGLFFLPGRERALALAPGAALTKPHPRVTLHNTHGSSRSSGSREPQCGALVRLVPCAMALRGQGVGGGKSWWHLDLQLRPLLSLLPHPSSHGDTSSPAGPLLPGAQTGLLLPTTRDAPTTCRTTSLPSTSACHSLAFFSSLISVKINVT